MTPLRLGMIPHLTHDPFRGADRDDVQGDALVDFQLEEAIEYEVEYIVWIIDVDGSGQVHLIRLIDTPSDSEAGPWVALANCLAQLVNRCTHASIEVVL
jgi:hypothetical protein